MDTRRYVSGTMVILYRESNQLTDSQRPNLLSSVNQLNSIFWVSLSVSYIVSGQLTDQLEALILGWIGFVLMAGVKGVSPLIWPKLGGLGRQKPLIGQNLA